MMEAGLYHYKHIGRNAPKSLESTCVLIDPNNCKKRVR